MKLNPVPAAWEARPSRLEDRRAAIGVASLGAVGFSLAVELNTWGATRREAGGRVKEGPQ